MALRHFTKYMTDPKKSFEHKYHKIKEKSGRKYQFVKNRLTGAYTPKEINLSWEGKPLRYDLVNKVIKEFGNKDYLEIGCFRDDCFSRIVCQNKVGVDPMSGGTLRMTSDDFFIENKIKKQKFDFIFIDGLHEYSQVRKDILNALEILNDGGTIMLHDCLPLKFGHQVVPPEDVVWNGDVWKAFVEARTWDFCDAAVCLIDHGVGMIKKRPNRNKLDLNASNFKELKFSDLADNYEKWLNPYTFDKAMDFVK